MVRACKISGSTTAVNYYKAYVKSDHFLCKTFAL